jgi:radical SAM superfamily enzyme with C-terminal helix-hairpin-helix motif
VSATMAILDGYTVEPSGLGVPPYLSTYVRDAYSALQKAYPLADVRYLTIDDVRWCLNDGTPSIAAPHSDPRTYSATMNRDQAIQTLTDATVVVIVAGDKVPSMHLHAENATAEELARALAWVRGRRVLLGPLATYALAEPATYADLFDAIHTHTITSGNLLLGSKKPAHYGRLRADRSSYEGLIAQLRWCPLAEIELYRGCTRRQFCSFCNEPVKAPLVDFRSIDDVLNEIALLTVAGVRNFRLGQQTCFFSYQNRDVDAIERLLVGVHAICPDLEVLHIDNADPLAVASPNGLRIARHVATYCTEGNCAPMGVETFDPVVVRRNLLTCTPEILLRAVEHVNDAGADRGRGGLPKVLPGLNLIYGLPGETHATHLANLVWLQRIFDSGLLCHRTNVRQARVLPGTPLIKERISHPVPSTEHFPAWKADIDRMWSEPMKQKVYPMGLRLPSLHSFFITSLGTWYRRLGSYSIQVVEKGTTAPLYYTADLTITGHGPRFLYGERHAA